VLPDNTFRNYNGYKECIQELSATQLPILCDPQTSGGLLISTKESDSQQVENLLTDQGLYAKPIGMFKEKEEKFVTVK
jgi:selenide,water dikinase